MRCKAVYSQVHVMCSIYLHKLFNRCQSVFTLCMKMAKINSMEIRKAFSEFANSISWKIANFAQSRWAEIFIAKWTLIVFIFLRKLRVNRKFQRTFGANTKTLNPLKDCTMNSTPYRLKNFKCIFMQNLPEIAAITKFNYFHAIYFQNVKYLGKMKSFPIDFTFFSVHMSNYYHAMSWNIKFATRWITASDSTISIANRFGWLMLNSL